MSAFIEPLILYLVLFLPGAIPRAPPPDSIIFSASGEFLRIIIYNIPSLGLIWYLLLRLKNFRKWGIGLPRKKDAAALLVTFPALILIGLTISAIVPFFAEIPGGARIEPPETVSGWVILVFSCLTTGYLEESFFRFYLHRKFEEYGVPAGRTVVISTLLFAICHIYEGPWGCLNAVLAGFLFSLVFIHFRSLHGIALAHGMFNIFVYATGA
jgi:membrane protease YdiL (CAAX protease family)